MNNRNANVFGVLLAAGSGSRLGMGAKALLRKANGQSLLASAMDALLGGGCSHIVVVLGADADQVAAELGGSAQVEVLVNHGWSSGMGSSLSLGLGAVPDGSAALVALVDQPGLSAELVRRILAGHRPGRITAAGYRRIDAPLRRGHPVLFAPEHLKPAAASAAGDTGARPYLAAHRDRLDVIDCSDLDTGLDIDTVADLRLLGGN